MASGVVGLCPSNPGSSPVCLSSALSLEGPSCCIQPSPKRKSSSVVYVTISRSSPLSVGRIPQWGLTSLICVLPILGPFTGGSVIQPFRQPGLPPGRKVSPGVEEIDPRVKFRHCFQRKEQRIIKAAASRFSRLVF